MTPLAAYLAECSLTRATKSHTAETSFYPAVKNLLDAVGDRLRPQVVCVMNLRNQGAGLPDGGLFTVDQLTKLSDGEGTSALKATPSRGAIEVKPPTANMPSLASSSQVTRYGNKYRHVLITNLREFWLVEYDETTSKGRVRDRFTLAKSESEFWFLASRPSDIAEKEPAFIGFLERVLRTPAPLATPEDLAWFLASYARDALSAIEHAPGGAVEDVAEALSATLGVGFRDAKGKHFFNSTLVQTIFYGVFSAWVLWGQQSSRKKTDRFQWRDTTDLLHLPILRVLFHEMTRPTNLFVNALKDRLDLAESALNRVDRAQFNKRFREHEAVQYFYEPFLEAFDADLRRELGVWYTPDEVVRYMVERVDRALRDDLGIAAGLADPDVLVLDPSCGTGAFLLAVLERIATTIKEQGEDATLAAQLVEAVTSRIYGFEILPAPFVISHLQINLYLQRLGAKVPDSKRAGVFLTNALTGWEKPVGKQAKLPKEYAEERAAANHVKQKSRVLVVLGNPPYNAFAGVQPEGEQESVDIYKEGLATKWGVRKFNLDDLFVRFFRLAERKIAEQTGRGIVCYVSSASYAADPSFVVLRERLVHQFDSLTIDNLNGDSRETGKLTPDGKPDPSIFSTERNREGIRVGASIGLFVLKGAKKASGKKIANVRWREFWGADKRQQLMASLSDASAYTDVKVSESDRWSFRPRKSESAYRLWWRATDICQHDPVSGLAEKRKGGLFSLTKEPLVERMTAYFDAALAWGEVRPMLGGLADDAGRYPAKNTRQKLIDAGEVFSASNVRRYAMFMLDTRYCYYSSSRPLWNEPRPILAPQVDGKNRLLVVRSMARQPGEGIPAVMVSALPDHHMLDPNVVAIPLRWHAASSNGKTTANLSTAARSYLDSLGIKSADKDEHASSLVWFHYFATVHSPKYLAVNGDAVRADYPRVPMPADKKLLEKSAELGRRIADLLDQDVAVPGVTTGSIVPELRPLGALRKSGHASIDPASGDLAVTSNWGALQRGSVVMPGRGRTTPNETLQAHPLGTEAIDVWLNGTVCWGAVPKRVWEFTVGGYQVIKKWLSYREKSVLGRDLTLDEARHLTAMVRRIASVLMLSTELDDSYGRCAASPLFSRPDAAIPSEANVTKVAKVAKVKR